MTNIILAVPCLIKALTDTTTQLGIEKVVVKFFSSLLDQTISHSKNRTLHSDIIFAFMILTLANSPVVLSTCSVCCCA